MIRRCLIAGLMIIELLAVGELAEAASGRTMDRATIRQMPVVERPYRFGHIYGNNVRRLHKLTR